MSYTTQVIQTTREVCSLDETEEKSDCDQSAETRDGRCRCRDDPPHDHLSSVY